MKQVNEVIVAKASDHCSLDENETFLNFALHRIVDFNSLFGCILDAVFGFANWLLSPTNIQLTR